MSAPKTSARDPILAPLASYSESGNPAATPAPDSTMASIPALDRACKTPGTKATLASPGKVSVGTPTVNFRSSATFDLLIENNPQMWDVAGPVRRGELMRKSACVGYWKEPPKIIFVL